MAPNQDLDVFDFAALGSATLNLVDSDKRGFDKALNLESIYTKFGRLIKTHLDTGRWDVNGE